MMGAPAALVVGAAMVAAESPPPGSGVLLGPGGDLSGFVASDATSLTYAAVAPPGAGVVDPAGSGKPPVGIGVIDSGVNPDHPQLEGLVRAVRSFVGTDGRDPLGHGTAVAILASRMDAPVYSARVLDDDGSIPLQAVLHAIDWLEGLTDVRIVNLSLGFETSHPGALALCDRLREAGARRPDVLFVAAAGNRGTAVRYVPAACELPNVLAVASDEPASGIGDIIAPPSRMTDLDGLLAQLGSEVRAAMGGHRLDEAATLLRRMRRLRPDDASIAYSQATVEFHRADLPAALAAVQTVLAQRPEDAAALWLAALIHANLADRMAALAHVRDLLARQPGHQAARSLHRLLLDPGSRLPEDLQRLFAE